jgi:hypothetical protein
MRLSPQIFVMPFTMGNDAEAFYLDVKSANDPDYKAYTLGPYTTDEHKDMHATRDEAKEIWRMRLGHPADERLRKMPEYCVDVPASLKQLPARKADDINEVARISNSQRRADSGKHGPWRTTTVGKVMANDILEMPVRSVLTGYKYVDVFYDVHSGLVFAYPMRFKSEHPTMLRRFLANGRDFFTTKRLHSDTSPCSCPMTSAANRAVPGSSKGRPRSSPRPSRWPRQSVALAIFPLPEFSFSALVLWCRFCRFVTVVGAPGTRAFGPTVSRLLVMSWCKSEYRSRYKMNVF